MKEIPFSPCQACIVVQEGDPRHVIREARRVIVIPEDAEHEICGMALCRDHHQAYKRIEGWRESQQEEREEIHG